MKTILDFLEMLVLLAVLACFIGFGWAMYDTWQHQTAYLKTITEAASCEISV